MRALFRQFSFPGGIPSHVAPETPGLDPRGRRARLRAGARLRRGVRQPRPARGLRGRRRRGRDRAAGRQLALQQVPQPGHATARCCRSCTSTATRSPTRPCWPASRDDELRRAAARATATRRTSSPATTRRRCTSSWPPTLDAVARRDRRDPARGPRAAARRERPALADDRAAHARRAGPGPKEVDGLQVEGTCRAHQVPLADVARPTPSTWRSSRQWMRSYRPEELFDADGRAASPSWRALAPERRPADERQPARQRRPAAARPAAARLPRLRRRRSTSPATTPSEATRVLGAFLRDVIARNPRRLPALRPGRDGVQPAGGGVRGDRPRLGRRDAAPATTTWPPTAG